MYDLQGHFRKNLPDVVTLPQHFKNHGYHVQGFSKIYHSGLDDPASWSVPHWVPGGPAYGKPETLAGIESREKALKAEGRFSPPQVLERDPTSGLPLKIAPGTRVRGPAWEDPDVPDDALNDGQTADRVLEAMRQHKDHAFFLAVGFLKPHLPFVAPRRYFDLHPLERFRPASNQQPPEGCPAIALTDWTELRRYEGIPASGPLPEQMQRELIRAYYASVSYVDAQIGRLLDELDRLGLAGRTMVVLWGDHGWQLGEHGLWCKHTNFELATRSVLIVRAPGRRAAGAATDALVEFVDVYPTLCELCGLDLPDGLEGTSAVPLLDNPARPWKAAAFSQYPRGRVMGRTIRTDHWRYTLWAGPGGQPVGEELYDHRFDPGENVNLAERPQHREEADRLRAMLEAGWRAATSRPAVE